MFDYVPFIVGAVALKSDLSIEEVGEKIAEKLFGSLKFIGKEEEIYEEVPAVYIAPNILGLRIILQGYSGMEDANGFSLGIHPAKTFKNVEMKECKLDGFLTLLLKDALKDVKEIQVIDV